MMKSGGPVLLLGSARSGTTLLQRILNSYDEVMIWGEHNGALNEVAESYFNLLDSKPMSEFCYPQAKGKDVALTYYKNPEQWQAWNNWFRREDVADIYGEFLVSIFKSPWNDDLAYWGFKEIRYGSRDKVAKMFVSCFPDTKILFLYRNPLNVIDSQLHAFHRAGGKLQKIRKLMKLPKIVRMAFHWRRMNRELLMFYRAYPKNVIAIRYEDMISDNKVLDSVMSRIGLSFGEKQKEVLHLKGGRGSAYHGKSDGTNSRWRSLGWLPAITVYVITRSVYSELKET